MNKWLPIISIAAFAVNIVFFAFTLIRTNSVLKGVKAKKISDTDNAGRQRRYLILFNILIIVSFVCLAIVIVCDRVNGRPEVDDKMAIVDITVFVIAYVVTLVGLMAYFQLLARNYQQEFIKSNEDHILERVSHYYPRKLDRRHLVAAPFAFQAGIVASLILTILG
ncbi:MAG: hypothetical protein IKD14_02490 [Clostridia bacterium]|nr:hypothetical protein [Clostridia bacterium]